MIIVLLLIFFIFTLPVIVMKIFYIVRNTLSMADLRVIMNVLSGPYLWIWVNGDSVHPAIKPISASLHGLAH
jgi:hypothetical protein